MPNITNFPKGKVGIGTENPTETLDVRGTLRVTGSTGTGTTLLGRDGNGNVSNMSIGTGLGITNGQLFATGTTSGTGSTSQVAYWTGTNSIAGENNLWWDSGNDRLGIGTNNPQQTLHVAGNMRLTGSTGTANSIMGRDGNFDVSSISIGSGLSLSGNTLTATGTSSITDGDKGDIIVSSGGTVWTIDNNVVSNSKLRQSNGYSVIGRAINGAGDVADIQANADGSVLRRSGSTLAFGVVGTAGIEDGAITNIKVASNIDAVKIANGTVDNTEFQFLNGVTSNIQDQINARVSGTGTTNYVPKWSSASGLTDSIIIQTGSNVDIRGTLRVTGSTGTGTTLMARNANFDVSAISVGTGLSLAGNTLTTTGSTTGTGAAGRVTYWASSTELSSDNNLLWDSENDWLGIGVTPTVPLQVQSPSNASIRLVRTTSSPSDFYITAIDSKLNITGGRTFTISTTGLGLGTDAPAQTLHVAGTMRLTGSTATTPTTIMGRDGNGDISAVTIGSGLLLSGNQLTATGGSIGTVTGSGTATQVAFWDGTSSLTGSTNLYWDNGNNRLGIGTTSPSNQLTTTQDILIANTITAGKGGNNITDNTAFGVNALSQNPATLASGNTAIGFNTLTGNTAGGSNTAIGVSVLQRLGAGSSNVGVGAFTLSNATTSVSDNVAVGRSALGAASINLNDNTAIGRGALGNITTGSTNAALGSYAGFYTTGTTAVTSANNSIFIGANTRAANISPSNQIVIGQNTLSLGNNTTTIGTTGTTQTHLYGNLTLGLTGSDAATRLKVNSSTNLSSEFAAKFQNNSGIDIMVIRGDGNVGIGTNTPTVKFQVVAAGNGSTAVFNIQNSNPTNILEILENGRINQTLSNSTNSTGFGTGTLSVATGANNTAFGVNSLQSSTNGASNTAIGKDALILITAGSTNTGIGVNALGNITTGGNNIGIGSDAGWRTFGNVLNQTSSNSIYLGNSTRSSADGNSHEIVIGNSAAGIGSNTAVLGSATFTNQTHIHGNLTLGSTTADSTSRFKVTSSGTTSSTFAARFQNSGSTDIMVIRADGNVGIGTSTPAQALHVAGNMRLTGSTGTGTTLMARDGNFDISAITVGSGLSLAGNTLTTTGSTGVSGTGTTNYLSRWTSSTGLGNSLVYQTGNTVGINTTSPTALLYLKATTSNSTATAFEVTDSADRDILNIRNDGRITVGKNLASTTQTSATIEAAGSDTDISLVLAPKGNGALVANVPDGNATGGNARGQYAVDLQLSRGANINVANGDYSVIIGGSENTASGIRSSVIGGDFNIADGTCSSVIGGSGGKAYLYGQVSTASGLFGSRGDAQTSTLRLRRSMIGTSQTELFLDGASLQAILPTTNSLWNVKVQIAAIVETIGNGSVVRGDSFVGEYGLGIRRLNTNTTVLAEPATIFQHSSSTLSGSTVSISADNGTEALSIKFNPPSATVASNTVMRVVATVYLTEVKLSS